MKFTPEKQDELNEQLFAAIKNNDLAAVKAAVAAGADINANSQYGITPLIESISDSVDIKITDFLLEHGANPNLQDVDGNTALHHISFSGDITKAKLLLENKADMCIKNNKGYTPFAKNLDYDSLSVSELFVLNGYLPAEEDFEVVKDTGKRNELKAQFMELARTVKVNAVQKEVESEVYCDECFDF